MKSLSIFTPTYNRAYILPELYKSLCNQTCKDFVWIVVDDGSTDNTRELVRSWINEGVIHIEYHFQENGGKMRAHNTGVKLANTELFVCIDSDDKLSSPTVINDNLKFWNLQKKQNFNGVISYKNIAGLVSYRKLKYRNSEFPTDTYCSTLSKLYNEGFRGDTTLVFRTDVLREFPFPEIEGEKFITEAYAYDLIDQNYQLVLFRYYSQDCDYRDDGYSNNTFKMFWENPKGYRLYYNQLVDLRKGSIMKNITRYIGVSMLINDHKTLSLSKRPLLVLLLYPIGILKFIRYHYLFYKLSHGKKVSI